MSGKQMSISGFVVRKSRYASSAWGSNLSSLSSGTMIAPEAAWMPWFRAEESPPLGLDSDRTGNGYRYCSKRAQSAFVSASVEPSLTTIISVGRADWNARLSRQSVKYRPWLKQGTTIEKV